MKYDVERFVDEVTAFFKANFNNKLTEIDTEKNDGIILNKVNENAYVSFTMSEKAFNENPFVFIGITSLGSDTNGASIASNIAIEIVIVLTDTYDNTIDKKLLRYQRAMREIFVDNFKRFGSNLSGVEISNQIPIQFQTQNSDVHHKAIGIEVTKTIVT